MFSFGRRAIDLAVLFLAVYALAFVPLGRRTGLEHLRAIFGTRAARDAGREIEDAATRLGRKLLGPAAPAAPRGVPVVPAFPRHANAAASLVHTTALTDAAGDAPIRACVAPLLAEAERASVTQDRCEPR